MFTQKLIKRFVRDSENTAFPAVRAAYGKLAGIAGVIANILLFSLKLLAGLLSGSVAVIADAFNNLSDAGSSIVTLVGFRLAGSPPDAEHPFGHGRVEYLSALTVAALIMLAGFELAGSAVDKILNPTAAEFSVVSTVILVAAIAVKLWLAIFNHKIGTRIHSGALTAAAADSRNDVICTSVVLLSSIFTYFTDISVDGYVGLAVSLFVVWSGFSILRETLSPLLGEAPDAELVEQIRELVLSHDGIVGIHDLIVHNYGPGRCIVSLHAEVPMHTDILYSHEVIDMVERELVETLNVQACIHMDPIDTQDEHVRELRELTATILCDIDDRLTLHDFRVVRGEARINVIFDVVVPFGFEKTGLHDEIERRLQAVDSRLFVVVTVEHSFV